MTIQQFLPDFSFTNLTLASFAVDLFWLTLLDLLSGVLAAVRTGTLDVALLPQFLQTHVLARVVPLLAAFFIATQGGGNLIPVTVVVAGALAYLAAVVQSLVSNVLEIQAGPGPAAPGVPNTTTP